MAGVPTLREFYEPILRALAAADGPVRRRELAERVADLLRLDDDARQQRIPSGLSPRYVHRSGWAALSLAHAGLVETPSSGVRALTAEGRRFVTAHPGPFGKTELAELQRLMKAGQAATEEDEGASVPSLTSARHRDDDDELTPDERIDVAVSEVRAAVSQELLGALRAAPPAFFEKVVLDLLHAMGYGLGRESLESVGGSGDGGIDGIISLDRLGLEKVYVQAKRWQGTVGRPEIQGFFGALAGRRAKKGVFMTTSSYTREAKEFAASVSDSLVLVDGAQLTRLMMDHGVGVEHKALAIPRINRDYFDE